MFSLFCCVEGWVGGGCSLCATSCGQLVCRVFVFKRSRWWLTTDSGCPECCTFRAGEKYTSWVVVLNMLAEKKKEKPQS